MNVMNINRIVHALCVASAETLPDGTPKWAPGGKPETGRDITIPDADVPKEYRQLAIKNIDRAYDIQYRKGGIVDLEEAVKGEKAKTGELVFELVKWSVTQAGNDLRMAVAWFRVGCQIAESHLKSKDKERRVKGGEIEAAGDERTIAQILPTWSQYKSGHLKSLTKGIDPNARRPKDEGDSPLYSTAAQYKEAGKDLPGAREQGGTTGQKVSTLNVVKGLAQFTDRMSAGLTVLVETLRTLSPAEQDGKPAEIVTRAAGEIAAFHSAWVAEHPAAGPAVQQPANVGPGTEPAQVTKEARKRGGSK